jgi:hypothetical protein
LVGPTRSDYWAGCAHRDPQMMPRMAIQTLNELSEQEVVGARTPY